MKQTKLKPIRKFKKLNFKQQLMSGSRSTTSIEPSPTPSPASGHSGSTGCVGQITGPKYGTLIPNRIFVGGISANTTEQDLHQLFSSFGNVKATKIISDKGGVSKGYGFVTFETEEEAKKLQDQAENIILKERKLNIAPAIKKQPPFGRTYEMGQPMMNGAVYYHNGIAYTYQNGVAVFHEPATVAAAAAAAAGSPQQFMLPAGSPFMLPAGHAAAANPAPQQFQYHAAQAAAQAAVAAVAAANQQNAAAAAALQQPCSVTGTGTAQTITSSSMGGTPVTSVCPPWRWVCPNTGTPTTSSTTPSVAAQAHQAQQFSLPQSSRSPGFIPIYTVPPPTITTNATKTEAHTVATPAMVGSFGDWSTTVEYDQYSYNGYDGYNGDQGAGGDVIIPPEFEQQLTRPPPSTYRRGGNKFFGRGGRFSGKYDPKKRSPPHGKPSEDAHAHKGPSCKVCPASSKKKFQRGGGQKLSTMMTNLNLSGSTDGTPGTSTPLCNTPPPEVNQQVQQPPQQQQQQPFYNNGGHFLQPMTPLTPMTPEYMVYPNTVLPGTPVTPQYAGVAPQYYYVTSPYYQQPYMPATDSGYQSFDGKTWYGGSFPAAPTAPPTETSGNEEKPKEEEVEEFQLFAGEEDEKEGGRKEADEFPVTSSSEFPVTSSSTSLSSGGGGGDFRVSSPFKRFTKFHGSPSPTKYPLPGSPRSTGAKFDVMTSSPGRSSPGGRGIGGCGQSPGRRGGSPGKRYGIRWSSMAKNRPMGEQVETEQTD